MQKIPKLQKGDQVALLSPSWGGPHEFPHVYELGKKRLEEVFGFVVKEYPSTLATPEQLKRSPEMRAKDIQDAFSDPNIKAIISTIGGEDSVRVLPFLDFDELIKHPKVLLGYSDTSTLLSSLNILGLVTFHGPSVMAGFAEPNELPGDFVEHINSFFFENWDSYSYQPFQSWSEELLLWSDPTNLEKRRKFHSNSPWRILQGKGVHEGVLFGGNIEVLEFLKGTQFWPDENFWEGRFFFLETSEEVPSVDQVIRILRNYASQGVFQKINGLLIGRARGYSDQDKQELDSRVLEFVRNELDLPNLALVTGMDFGHTDPQWVLPLGVKAELNLDKKTFSLLESPFL